MIGEDWPAEQSKPLAEGEIASGGKGASKSSVRQFRIREWTRTQDEQDLRAG